MTDLHTILAFPPQFLTITGLIFPLPALLSVAIPSFETFIAGGVAIAAAWRIIKKKLAETSEDGEDDDCHAQLRRARRINQELHDEFEDADRRRRHAEELADERRRRIEILERYLDVEGDRHPRDRGNGNDRP